MGLFEVTVKLANPAVPEQGRDVALLVDTGATLSWIPKNVLESLGVKRISKLPFQLADGPEFEREVGNVLVTVDGRTAPVAVGFGEVGEESLLGATSLETLGFTVDPVAKKLLPRDLLVLRFKQPSIS